MATKNNHFDCKDVIYCVGAFCYVALVIYIVSFVFHN